MAASDPVADLHVHTTCSDGTLVLNEIPAAARQAGIEAVAVTDHDRVHPNLSAPVSVRGDVAIVRGIELRVEVDAGPARGMRVDLLGYGVEPTLALQRETDRLGRDRAERGAAIIKRVEDHLGIDLDLVPHPGMGRPHIARAIADHPQAPYDFQGAFDRLIGGDGPCFVPRQVPSFERGRNLLVSSCALVGLAHPFRYPDPVAALGLASELHAVERWYPYGREVDPGPVERAITEHGLLPTGGSDAHDDHLGRAGLPAEAYRRFRKHLRFL